MTTKKYSVHEIATEFDRLFARNSELVDNTEVGWGQGKEAGYVGHEHENEDSTKTFSGQGKR
jgi:hypothetical protein